MPMSYTLQGETGTWEIVCGLEVHAQVTSQAKLFSGASTEFGAEPNSQVSFVDAGFPGHAAGDQPGMRGTGGPHRAWAGRADQPGQPVRPQELFLRRPAAGLPDQPARIIRSSAPGTWRSRWTAPRGESASPGCTWSRTPASPCTTRTRRSVIDLNRSGVALMEIVSEPDIRSPEEAGAYVRKLRQILRYLGTCDGNMEEGSMRADVNVSVRKHGEPFPHPVRDQKRQLGAVRHARGGGRGEAPDRGVGSWRRWLARRPGCTTRRAAKPARCAPRKTPTTTGIFPTRTCCRWCWTRLSWRR